MNNLIIIIQVDYGAEEYIWYSSFANTTDLIEWWENVPSIDILDYDPYKLINEGELKIITNEVESNFGQRYSIDNGTSIMMDNDYSSYLYYGGKQYRHKGHKVYINEQPIIK